MDTSIILYAVAVLAVLFRIYAQAGYKLAPFYDETTGKFQINVIGIIVTGFMAAIPIVQQAAVPVNADMGVLITAIVTVFTAIYGVPAVIDKIGTAITPSPTEA